MAVKKKERTGTAKKSAAAPAVTEAAEGPAPESPLISNARLKQIYVLMLQCRLLEKSAHAAIGHEAALVATALELAEGDTVAAANSGFIFTLVKGVLVKKVLKERASAKTKPVKFSTLVKKATTAALSHKRKKKNVPVSLVYADDAAAAQAGWREAMKTAGDKGLPMVFVCQSDFFEQDNSEPVKTGGSREFGFPTIIVDGNDAVAVYRVAQEAMHRARTGRGATLIECRTYRWSVKLKTDGESSPSEAAFWQAKDPILRMQRFLEAKGLYSKEWAREIGAEFEREVDTAIAGRAAI
jgi:TPP-dependent pyruvate/acetoin dehydrogenase alpha subunit